jgi:hypothetical protein
LLPVLRPQWLLAILVVAALIYLIP